MKSVLQIGSVNWQTPEESSSGSGILHEGHHRAYNNLGLKTYSLYPSRVQSSTEGVEVLRLNHEIPIFTNIPTSSYRFSDMTDEEFAEYEKKLHGAVDRFVDRIESRNGTPLDLAVAHHAFLNTKVIADLNETRRREGRPKIPLVAFVHGTALKMYQRELDGGNPRFLPMMRKVIKDVDGVFTISKEQKALFHRIFPDYPRERVVVSPNGFDQRVFDVQPDLTKAEVLAGLTSTETTGSKQVPADADYVASFVGKFADWKRLGAVLQADKTYEQAFANEGKKVVTLVAGTGTEEQVAKYEGLANELGLKNVYFLGPQMHPSLARIYNISDIGVFPSKDEPFGLVLLECMACGTPVIGANSGGPRDFITDDVGYLVPEAEGDEFVKNLSDAVVRSWKEDWKTAKGPKAHQLAHEKYTLRVQVKGILDQVEKFLGLSLS